MKVKHTHSKSEDTVARILRDVEITRMKKANKMFRELGGLDWETWANLKSTMKPRYLNKKLLGHRISLDSSKPQQQTF